MKDLIEQLEKATGPDRRLDSAIARSLETLRTEPFVGAAPFERLEGMYWVFGKKDTKGGPVEEKWSKNPPLYTSSLDAALTLLPKGMQFGIAGPWYNNLEKRQVWYAEVAECVEDAAGDFSERAGTAMAALCVAALKARAKLPSS